MQGPIGMCTPTPCHLWSSLTDGLACHPRVTRQAAGSTEAATNLPHAAAATAT